MATTIQHIELPKKARALDTSGNNNHGQIYSGRGLEFDGVTDHLNIGSNITISTGAWTLACWVSIASTPTNVAFSVNSNSVGGNSSAYIGIFASSLKLAVYDWGNTAWKESNTPLKLNTWCRVVFSYDGDGTLTFYQNGVADGEVTLGTSGNDAHLFAKYIGSMSNETRHFDGKMANWQVWDTAWSAADVTYDYLNPESLALNNGGTALTESNLKLWYPMQDGHRGQQSYILDGANSGLGDEEITNGDFATDLSGWDNKSATSTWVSGSARIDNSTGNARAGLYQDIGLVLGNRYILTATMKLISGDANGNFKVITSAFNGSGQTDLYTGESLIIGGSSVTETINFTHSNSDVSIQFACNTTNAVFEIDNVSVKAINDKHHATTVFYGDELIETTANRDFSGAGQWVAYNSSTVEIDSAKLKVTIDGGGTAQRAQIPIVRVGDGSTTSVVAGRTYQISAKLDFISGADTDIVIYYFLGGVAVSVGTITTTEATYTGIVTAGDNTTALMIGAGATENDSGSDNVFTIDDVSVKEIGVASGWTDADQQLHIPQTALQSYNELAWFDGTIASDGYVDLDNQITTSGNPWSLSFWVFHDDNGQAFDFIVGDGGNQIITLNNNTVDKLSYRDSGNTYHAISDAAIPESEWVHIAITAIANTSMTAYINGVTQTTNSDMTDTTLLLERFMRGFSSDLYHTFGTINEISYYSDVLTATEVLDLFNDGKAKSALEASGSGGLVGYWRNNGLSEWKDLKGSNDGNVTAGVTETILIPQGVDSSRDNQGFIMNRQKDTSCFNNTANGGYIEIPVAAVDDDLAFLGVGDGFSVQVWIKVNGDSNGALILSRNNNTDGYRLEYNSSEKIVFGIEENGTIKTATTDSAISADTWYHIVGTFDGDPDNDGSGEIKLYLNGETGGSVTTNSTTSNDMDTSISPMRIGKHYWSGATLFDGAIDGVLIYDKVLELEEVERNYNATKGSHRN